VVLLKVVLDGLLMSAPLLEKECDIAECGLWRIADERTFIRKGM
jgi:hypothetical protein